jgi:hypothetical protein
MIFGIIRGFLGEFGRVVLDFYLANSLSINSLVLIYGLFIFFSRRNYLAIWQRTLFNIGFDPEKQNHKLKISKSLYKKIDWQEISNSIWFPFITAPGKWNLELKNEKSLKILFSIENIRNLLSQ